MKRNNLFLLQLTKQLFKNWSFYLVTFGLMAYTLCILYLIPFDAIYSFDPTSPNVSKWDSGFWYIFFAATFPIYLLSSFYLSYLVLSTNNNLFLFSRPMKRYLIVIWETSLLLFFSVIISLLCFSMIYLYKVSMGGDYFLRADPYDTSSNPKIYEWWWFIDDQWVFVYIFFSFLFCFIFSFFIANIFKFMPGLWCCIGMFASYVGLFYILILISYMVQWLDRKVLTQVYVTYLPIIFSILSIFLGGYITWKLSNSDIRKENYEIRFRN